MTPAWAQLGYPPRPSASSSRSRGCPHPKTARRGNLIGAAGAVLACLIVSPVFRHRPSDTDLGSHRSRHGVGVLGAYRVQMTQMPSWCAVQWLGAALRPLW